MLPADLLAALLGGRLEAPPGARLDLRDLVSDSRAVTPGAGFIALVGEVQDGHSFVSDAARRGAVLAVVSERFQPDGAVPELLIRVPDTAAALRTACSRRLAELGTTVIGVTGSVGKTTAKEMCALALSGRPTARTPGNLNTWTQIPIQVLRLEPPVEFLVAEMAMTARGEIADLASFTHPRVGILLNVGQAHIGLLGSEEAIADAKAELLDALPADGRAVLNADDPRVVGVAGRSRAPVSWFAVDSPEAGWRVEDVVEDGVSGIRCTLAGPDGRAPLRLGVPGRHLLLDAVAAAAAASALGVGIARRRPGSPSSAPRPTGARCCPAGPHQLSLMTATTAARRPSPPPSTCSPPAAPRTGSPSLGTCWSSAPTRPRLTGRPAGSPPAPPPG